MAPRCAQRVTDLVKSHVVRRVRELGRVDAQHLPNVDVGAVGVDLRVVRVQRRVGDPVHVHDPLARATQSVSARPKAEQRPPTHLAVGGR